MTSVTVSVPPSSQSALNSCCKIQAPTLDTQTPAATVDRFSLITSGLDGIAKDILKGTYKSSDPAIVTYYRKLHAGPFGRDSMGLLEMESLARAILRETKKATNLVGGPDQIAVYPVKGKPRIFGLEGLPTAKEIPSHFILNTCSVYGKGPQTSNEPCSGTFAFEDFTHELEEPVTQFFLACIFQDVPIALDYNFFVNSEFNRTTFKYLGKKPPFARGNRYSDCTVELPETVEFDRDSEIFSHCRLVRKKTVDLNQDTLGVPFQHWDFRVVTHPN
jgi:hypothetical protein